MIETRHLKNSAIFFQTILSFVMSRKIVINDYLQHYVNIFVKEYLLDNYKSSKV